MADKEYSEIPTVGQIIFEVDKLPPLQRAQAIASEYLGKKVYWQTRFFDVVSVNRDPVMQVSFSIRGIHLHGSYEKNVYALIDVSREPALRDLKPGRRVDLWGRISDVDNVLGITLQLDRLEVLPETLTDKIVERAERHV